KSIYILFISIFALFGCEDSELPIVPETTGTPTGTALIITGAAARINQQIALIERLHDQNKLNNLDFVSGVSSGGINAIMLNGILDNTNDFGFESYKDIVLNLTNADVLDNSRNDLPIDTKPLWNTFETKLLEELNYTSFDDLFMPTALTSTNLDLKEIEFSSNITELDNIGGDLIESLMATTSFPVAFPSIKINDNIYVDGGLIENIPVNAVMEYQRIREAPFDTVYIVSYQKNTETRWSDELDYLSISGTREDILKVTLEKAGFDTDALSQQSFLNELLRIANNYPELASRCYVYVPNVADAPYYGVFDFSSETAHSSYNSVSIWAQSNEPVPLDAYLAINGININ
ncbi:MAG: hypothetical protein CMO01_03110, partial [Thalassobius sp.]|nr:hypothetical protein [Thalassovita sp.]